MATPVAAYPRTRLTVTRLLRPRPQRLDTAHLCRRCLSVQQKRQQHASAEPRRPNSPVFLERDELFSQRHIGPSPQDEVQMVKALDPPAKDLDDFIRQTLPPDILAGGELRLKNGFNKDNTQGVHEVGIERELLTLSHENKNYTTFIGTGYYGTNTPSVIQRNVLESPAWYTSYTPYQAEISQGRLESLLNFQTLVTDLTGLTIANASVLDEGTAAAEAMTLSMNALPASRQKKPGKTFVVSDLCHPQTIAVLESRATGFGINIVVGDILASDFKLVKDQGENLIGVLAQYPDTTGGVHNFQSLSDIVHAAHATFCVATDLLALTLLKAPGEFGADVAFGNAQRFGVPLGYGGPHAAFFACSEKHKRKIPGRLVGVSKDRLGKPALRLALQTREQHIRREKATSNICTAQALLANMSAFYAIYHGPHGLKKIAKRIWAMAKFAQAMLERNGLKVVNQGVREDGAVLFDTVVVQPTTVQEYQEILQNAQTNHVLLRTDVPGSTPEAPLIGFSLDETVNSTTLMKLLRCFGVKDNEFLAGFSESDVIAKVNDDTLPKDLQRQTPYLTHPVFNQHHSETELLRYIHHLQSKDLSLVHSMIPLGSCTMKLNGTTEMLPVSYAGFSKIHPFTPIDLAGGYQKLIKRLSTALASITGMQEVSLQPNSGAQGEFAGLRVIKKYLDSKDSSKKRNICLIPVSAHGTNPASAAMAGMKVVPLKCDTKTGNLDFKDLQEKCEKHKDELAAIMITYPSTFGVFERGIKEVCKIVHEHGGQVYMDGANMNAQIGLCSPGEIGADVCHLNLHKTFCIPHGGGGPGVGPIAVKEHLRPFLPMHPHADPHAGAGTNRATTAISPVSSAPWGSASILPISYAYIQLMGSTGLKHGTEIALLNANYLMSRLRPHYPILYTNENGRCAHEFILDARQFKETAGVEAIDIAKRLQDYGFHAPTMSWPVANTLMIEPTESESKEELDRFCDALIEIRKEIKAIEDGEVPREGNVLKMSPHPAVDLMKDYWDRPYSRQQAAYPLPWLREKKFWPSVARVDDAYGDTNLFCTCTPVEGYEEEGLTGHQAPMPT
ncbi:glycine dehydrogenase [Capronia epimyces CBS 606.96]|uniref:Glycine cleavage system P protein n=1 Tax=Capronia epimyces CBS 606.96 TaxID=1182542 RepID=W9XTU6_9EURO|nr:glycine dehydrogenase [Capronia epimyces CBS 606.96]EXJ80765.1 glycine dehydrogenase [Capronia epimyces CBS 606.96]